MSTVQMYRKKPVVVEAMVYELGRHESVMRWIRDGFGKAWLDIPDAGKNAGVYIVKIQTLEGAMDAMPGDYIIKGLAGEFYPCKPHIFAQTYEALAWERKWNATVADRLLNKYAEFSPADAVELKAMVRHLAAKCDEWSSSHLTLALENAELRNHIAFLAPSPTTPEVEEALNEAARIIRQQYARCEVCKGSDRHCQCRYVQVSAANLLASRALSQPQAQPQEVPDRIDFICEPWVDDAVLSATSVHIEDLGENVWIGVYRADGDRFCFEVGPSADSPIGVCLTEGSVGSLATLSDTSEEES